MSGRNPLPSRTTPPDVAWSAREAFACALCWSGFLLAEQHRTDTPEHYWLSIDPRARADYRRAANEMLLLNIARREAVAILPPSGWGDDHLDLVGKYARLTARHRLWQIVSAVYDAAKTIRGGA